MRQPVLECEDDGVYPVPRPRSTYFSSRDSLRSASGLPPVWQVGQYWSEESLKETSRMVSPHTGQGSPVRPWTRRPLFFSDFSRPAASPRERSIASVRVVRRAS